MPLELPRIPSGAAAGDPARTTVIAEWCEWMRDGQSWITGPANHVLLVAIGIAEAALDNLAIGDNHANGSPSKVIGADRYGRDIDTRYSLGLGWLQHDSGWLEREFVVNRVQWTDTSIRADPGESLRLLVARPGFVLYDSHGTQIIDMTAWNAYRRARSYVREVGDIYHGATP